MVWNQKSNRIANVSAGDFQLLKYIFFFPLNINRNLQRNQIVWVMPY